MTPILIQGLSIYKKDQTSWSIWLYKDIGFQGEAYLLFFLYEGSELTALVGMVYCNSDTAYIRLLKPFPEKKKRLGVDKWGRDDTQVAHIYVPLLQHLKEKIPEKFLNKRYPHHWRNEGHVDRVLRETLFSEILTWEYATYFEGKILEELDELAASFKLENCVKRGGLNEILRADAEQKE